MVLTKIEYLSYYISLKNLGEILDFQQLYFIRSNTLASETIDNPHLQ